MNAIASKREFKYAIDKGTEATSVERHTPRKDKMFGQSLQIEGVRSNLNVDFYNSKRYF